MTNITKLDFKKVTRNDMLINLIHLARANIDKDTVFQDMMMVYCTADGTISCFGQTLIPVNPLSIIGTLEVIKLNYIAGIPGDDDVSDM